VRKGRQRWRRYVVPRDPRTPAQQRSRAIFTAVSRTWSADGALTDEQRDAWYAQGVKKRSRPRLGSSGKLTRQQDFVGRNCANGQRERGMFFEPLKPVKKKEESKYHNPALFAEAPQSQSFTRPTWETRRAFGVARRYTRRVPRGYLRKGKHRPLIAEVPY
jgi:hypothetical protein